MKPQTLTATEKIVLEEGYRQAYQKSLPDSEEPTPIKASHSRLNTLKKGQRVKPRRVVVQHQASPSGIRESDLIGLLEENGVGRPSTYAQVVGDLVRHRYARREDGLLLPTGRGREVCAFLLDAYPHIFTPSFTTRLERELDAIAEGRASYQETVAGVWEELL